MLDLDAKYVSIVSRLGSDTLYLIVSQGRSLGSNKQFRASASDVYIERGAASSTLLKVRKILQEEFPKTEQAPGTTVQLFSSLNKSGLEEFVTVLDHWFRLTDEP